MGFRGDVEALVLGVLQEGALHGYEIAKRIRTKTDALLKIGEGQLYPVLHKLEQEGRVEARWEPQEGKPPRKVYGLTADGRRELERQKSVWSGFVESVNAVLQAKPEPSRGKTR